ncbi:hypothetical protein, partial [Oceanisphaera psychrotolerans]
LTSAGHPRFQCKACDTTFTRGSEKRKSHPKTRSYDNEWLFKLLVNQTAINRAIELTDLPPQRIYDRIDMFYERSVAFMKERESRLKMMPLKGMRLSSDRQEYGVNWTNRDDRRNVVLSAIGSADSYTGYVFGMEVNFDPSVNLQDLAKSQQYQDDQSRKKFNRTLARIWTPREIHAAIQANKELEYKKKELLKSYFEAGNLPLHEARVASLAEEIELESGVSPVSFDDATTLPDNGALVRSEYTLCAHFRLLQELIGHADLLTLYLDQDTLINRAAITAFTDQVKAGTCRVAYVRFNKELTVDERRFRVKMTEKAVGMVMKTEELDRIEAERFLVQQSLSQPYAMSGSKEVWFSNPINRIYECEKYVSFLTDCDCLSENQKVSVIRRASLHPIDNFFQMVRRRLSLLERPMHSQSNNGRVWTGKSPYNPVMVEKMLQILRVYYNFCLRGKDGKTPAQRLGLAKGPVEIRKILYPSC